VSGDTSGIEQAEAALDRAKRDHEQVLAQRPKVRKVAVQAYQRGQDDFAELVIRAFEVRAS